MSATPLCSPCRLQVCSRGSTARPYCAEAQRHPFASLNRQICPARHGAARLLHTLATAAAPPTAGETAPALDLPKELTRLLMACPTVEVLLDMVELRWHELNLVNQAVAFSRVAKLVQAPGSGAPAPTALRSHPTVLRLADALRCTQQPWAGVSIINVLQAHAALGHAPPPLLDRVRQELEAGDLQFSMQEVVSLAHALARAGCRFGGVLAQLQAGLLATEEGGASANGGSSSSTPAVQPRKRLCEFRLADFPPDRTAMLACFLAQQRCSPELIEVLYSSLAGRALGRLTPTSLSLLLKGVAEGGSEATGSAAAEALAARLPRLLAPGSEFQRQLVQQDVFMLLMHYSALLRAAIAAEAGADAAAPTGTSHSLPKWTSQVQRYMERNKRHAVAAGLLATEAERLLPRMSGLTLSGVAYACARLQLLLRPSLLAALETAALPRLAGMDTRSLATLCWAFAALRHDSPAVMEAAAAELWKRSAQLSATQVVMALHAFAVLDAFDGAQARRLLLALIARAEEVLPEVDPGSLPTLAWSLAVAWAPLLHGSTPEGASVAVPGGDAPEGGAGSSFPRALLRQWRGALAAADLDLSPAQLSMLHHVEVALRLEAPHLGMDAPPEYEALFRGLYDSGRLRRSAAVGWGAQVSDVVRRRVSAFQGQVFTAAQGATRAVHPGRWELEWWEHSLEYPLDVALPELKVAIEADGPSHFTVNTRRPLGATALKRRLLARLGWVVVEVPFFEWDRAWGRRQMESYMQQKLRDAGVLLILQGAAAAQQAAVQREAASQTETLPDSRALPPSTASDGGDGPQPGGGEAVGVAERVQRLDLVRVRQGKLSRAGLVARTAARASAQAPKEEPAEPASDKTESASPSL